MSDRLLCPTCKTPLNLVLEVIHETPYRILEGSKDTGIFNVEQVAPNRPKLTGKSVKVYCVPCKARFYAIEYGELFASGDKFRFQSQHNPKMNFDSLSGSTNMEIPTCFVDEYFKLCERPRNGNAKPTPVR